MGGPKIICLTIKGRDVYTTCLFPTNNRIMGDLEKETYIQQLLIIRKWRV